MGKYKNVIIPLIIDAGQLSGRETVSTLPGVIKRCVISYGALNNPGMVRASTKDSAGDKISELQALEIYKIRNVEYKLDGVPMNIQGGFPLTFEIIATEAFTDDFHADLILIYEENETC